MCDLTGMSNTGIAAVGLQAVGAATSAFGARSTAQANQNAARYQAAIDANNAEYDSILASQAIIDGQTKTSTSRLKYGALKGTQTASLAAHGVDITQGSAKNILDDTDMMSDIDAATIQDNAARQAWGFKVQRSNDLSAASMANARADSISPDKAMFTSLIGSGATVAASWYSRRQPYGMAGGASAGASSSGGEV